MEALKGRKREREDTEESSEAVVDSPAVKRLREDFLDDLDEDSGEFVAAGQDLASFMKSFEEEITASDPSADLTSESVDSPTDIGYLLEASDDDLGLPPTAGSPSSYGSGVTGHELVRVDSDASHIGCEFWEIPSYDDSFGLGFGEADTVNFEYMALDGLFDYSDLGFGSGDLLCRPETLPAL